MLKNLKKNDYPFQLQKLKKIYIIKNIFSKNEMGGRILVIDKVKKVNKEETTKTRNTRAADMMIGKWVKCDNCKEIIYKEDLHKNLSVCPNCGKHFRLSARRRIKQIADEGTFQEIGADILTKDPLNFDGYMKKVESLREKTKLMRLLNVGYVKLKGKK